jgi:hypothetical protein
LVNKAINIVAGAFASRRKSGDERNVKSYQLDMCPARYLLRKQFSAKREVGPKDPLVQPKRSLTHRYGVIRYLDNGYLSGLRALAGSRD